MKIIIITLKMKKKKRVLFQNQKSYYSSQRKFKTMDFNMNLLKMQLLNYLVI
jgi:hypothetical protein